jgi:AAA15 family ATPase/GTPase
VAIVLQKKPGFTPLAGQSITPIDKGFEITAGCTEEPDGIVLLDEIENGINPYLTGSISGLLNDLTKTSRCQVILTTHSPVVLNDFKLEEIVFLWKDKNSSVHSKKFFDTEERRKALDFLNPGEIWENYGKNAILNKPGVSPEDR